MLGGHVAGKARFVRKEREEAETTNANAVDNIYKKKEGLKKERKREVGVMHVLRKESIRLIPSQ